MAQYLLGVDRRDFERRNGLRPVAETLIRGQFGNVKAKVKKAKSA